MHGGIELLCRDITPSLLTEVCNEVCVEPDLQAVTPQPTVDFCVVSLPDQILAQGTGHGARTKLPYQPAWRTSPARVVPFPKEKRSGSRK